MELIELLYVTLATIFLSLAYQLYRSKLVTKIRNLPPSPVPCLPLLGHLHLLGPPAHRAFQKLSEKYGPVISFKFGAHWAVIVSSPAAAEECFTKNDVVLANRPGIIMTFNRHLNYKNGTMVSAPYGEHWRNLRRIGTEEIFSPVRLSAFVRIRQDEVLRLLRKVGWQRTGSNQGFAKVDQLKSMFSDLAFNVVMRMIAGKRYYGDDEVSNKEEAREFKGLMHDISQLGGLGARKELSPLLNWISGGEIDKKFKALAERTDRFMQGLIEDHRNKKDTSATTTSSTMIDHLLSLQESQPEYYSDDTIKGLVVVMLLAGTDTTAVTLEWAMSNLVNHPDILEKAKKELDAQIGQERLMSETDLPNLQYLKNTISETLRLYPPIPLMLPHYSSGDCTIGSYNVHRHTMVVVNVWAIHRDPTLWNDPEAFRPERFEGGDQEVRESYKLMPFGFGRRACPGAGLAQRVLGLTLGSLIQCFEWKRVGEEMVDMVEAKGLTMPKAKPLEVMCKPRAIMDRVIAC